MACPLTRPNYVNSNGFEMGRDVRRFVGLPHPPSRRPGVIHLVFSRFDAEFPDKMELFKQQSLRRRRRDMTIAV
jgi:hypothetical protein